jgi:hypothetical protein
MIIVLYSVTSYTRWYLEYTEVIVIDMVRCTLVDSRADSPESSILSLFIPDQARNACFKNIFPLEGF